MKCTCGDEITRPGQRHCHACHAAAQREYRARVALEREQGQAALALLRRLDIHLPTRKEIQRVEITHSFTLSGDDLSAWRKQMKLTQKEFAEDYGYTTGTISKMETGQSKIARPLVAAYNRHVKQAQLALILFNNSDQKPVNLSAVKDCTE